MSETVVPLIEEPLTVAEVARALRVSKMTVYRLIKTGEIQTARIRRSYRIPAEAVRAYLAGSRDA